MEKLHINPTPNTPEIVFSPADNIFEISGISAPEDVRAIYYPVIDWFSKFSGEIRSGSYVFTARNPLVIKVKLEYFNSSSTKFLFDIFTELKHLKDNRVPVIVEWHYDENDPDIKDAGRDIASILGMEFTYVEDKTGYDEGTEGVI